jgi:hypothetical protein
MGLHPGGIGAARMTEPGRAGRFLPVRDERLQEPALLGGRMGTASAKGCFARPDADALRQLSGVQAHRQARCDDSVTGHRHGRITQWDAAPTRIVAAGARAVTVAGQ